MLIELYFPFRSMRVSLMVSRDGRAICELQTNAGNGCYSLLNFRKMNGTGMARCLLSLFILIIWFQFSDGEKISEKSMAAGVDISLCVYMCVCVCLCSSVTARSLIDLYVCCMCASDNHYYVHHRSLLHFGIVGVWRCESLTNIVHCSANEP